MSPFDALDFTAADTVFVAALDAAVREAIAAELWGTYADGLGRLP